MNAKVQVRHAGGSDVVEVDETKTPPIDGVFISLGTYDFPADQPAVVTVTNAGTKGYLVVDAVQWLPVK